MKKILFFTTLFCFATALFAQKETYNWYFPNGGLTWRETQTKNGMSGLPKPLPGCQFNIADNDGEGCFVASDANGNLLFYSDGMKILNKNNQIMTNGSGLTGGSSSAQSGIIIPYPEHPNQYIAFTIAQASTLPSHVPYIPSTNQASYSIVDMTLSGGLGAVTTKNVMLQGATGELKEQISAVLQANGKDYWVIAAGHRNGENAYLNVWSVTKDGVSASTVHKQMLPIIMGDTPADGIGYLSFSIDGKRWAIGNTRGILTNPNNTVSLAYGTFNPANGTFSNIRTLSGSYYGVEFSPSGKLLYLTEYQAAQTRNDYLLVYKFDELLNGVTSSRKRVDNLTNRTMRALQTGPDKRIYAVLYDRSDLLVVDNIEDYNNITATVIDGLMEGKGRLGLPNFLNEWFSVLLNPQTYEACIGETKTVTFVEPLSMAGTLHWYTTRAAAASGEISTTTGDNYTYTKTQAIDTFYVRVRNSAGNGWIDPSSVDTVIVRLGANCPTCVTAPSISVSGGDTVQSVCTGTSITSFTLTASAGATLSAVTWTPSAPAGITVSGSNAKTISGTPSSAGTYRFSVTATSTGCDPKTVTGRITAGEPAAPDASAQTFCNSATVANLTATGTNIKWYSGATGGVPLAPNTALSSGTNYYASQTTAAGCESARTAVPVTINNCVFRWWYLSSPYSDGNPRTFKTTADTLGGKKGSMLGYYDEVQKQYTEPFTASNFPANQYFKAGRGIVVSLDTTTAAFNPPTPAIFANATYGKTLNAGDITVHIDSTNNVPAQSTKAGRNLIGNPYLSYIDFNSFYNDNQTVMRSTLWIRGLNKTEMKMKYDIYSAATGASTANINNRVLNGHIPPIQGFWIHSTTPSGNVTFKETHKIANDASQILRSAKKNDNRILRLKVSSGIYSDEAIIVFNPQASDAYDLYDSEKISNGDKDIPELYSTVTERATSLQLAINGMSPVANQKSLPLGFRTGTAGNFTISATVENWDDTQVVLRDNTTGAETDLTRANAYSFSSGVYDSTARFTLIFRAKTNLTDVNNSANDELRVLIENGELKIENAKAGDKVQVFNTVGQKMHEETINSAFYILHSTFHSGVYLVKVGGKTKRVIVK